MPYQPTWNNQYLSQNPYQPVVPSVTYPNIAQQYQQVPTQGQATQGQGAQFQPDPVKVDGPTEAMNRFLMRYSNMLVPGFISEPTFDVNGRQFYVLSVEQNGRRNLETFDYVPHVEEKPVEIDGAQFVSKQEYDQFVAKVSAALEAINNGIHGPVQGRTTEAAGPSEPNDGAAQGNAAR